jgi:sugar lactone lactonase YvrE
LCDPQGVATDALGNTYVSDIYCRVRKIDADGKITTVAGDSAHEGRCAYSGDGGPANSAALAWPIGLATDAQGNLYIADTGNHCIRKVDGGGVITTFAGICTAWPRRGPLADGSGYSGDEGPATAARLHSPQGVAVDGAGNVYIADTGNSRIRKVDASGTITTVAGNGQPLVLP